MEIEHREQFRSGSVFLDRYEVVRCIRSGGMGSVYEVHDRHTKRNRALKTMLPNIADNPDLCARFRQEATIAANVDSEHIVDVLDSGIDEVSGQLFLVMELLKGSDLETQLNKSGPLSRETTFEILRQLVRVLDKTHAANVVHRDLKPANLFITTRDDGAPRLRVLDFGIAKVISQGSLARTTSALGTPIYMSPEQIHGDRNIGPQADLYSVAHIVFTLLVGHAYFERELERAQGVAALLYRVLQGANEPATQRAASFGVSLPATFDVWFARATAPEPEERFTTGKELYEALEVALGAQPESPSRPATALADPTNASTNCPVSRSSLFSRKRNFASAGVGMIVLLGAGFVYRASRHAGTPPAPASSGLAVEAASSSGSPGLSQSAPTGNVDGGPGQPELALPASTKPNESRSTKGPVINQPHKPRPPETPSDPTDIR